MVFNGVFNGTDTPGNSVLFPFMEWLQDRHAQTAHSETVAHLATIGAALTVIGRGFQFQLTTGYTINR